MAISFVGSSVSTGANPTVSIPSGVTTGDLLLIITTGTASPTTPTGWTASYTQGVNQFMTILVKYASSSETDVALTIAGTTTKAVMVVYRGATFTAYSTGTTTVSLTSSTGTAVSGSTRTTGYSNEWVISLYVDANVAATWTPNVSSNVRVNSASTASVNGLLFVDELKATAGASTARSVTLSSSAAWSSTSLRLIPSRTVYWVGGTNTWSRNAILPWADSSGGAGSKDYPGAVDDVVVDAASGSPTISLSGIVSCNSLTTTGSTCTITSTGSLSLFGNMLLSATTTWSVTGTLTLLESLGTSSQIITNGVSISSPILISDSNTSINLGSALTSTSYVNVSSGIFNANNYSVTTRSINVNSQSTRTLTMGAADFTLTGSGTVWDASTTANLTFNKGTSNIIMSNTTNSVARTFAGGNLTYNDLTFGGAAATGQTYTLTGNNSFGALRSTKTTAYTITFPNGTTNVNGFYVNGSAGQLVTLARTGASGTFTLNNPDSNGVAVNQYLSISNSTATGGRGWYAGPTSTNGTGNSGWLFTAAPYRFWVGGSNTWTSAATTNWSLISGGASGATVPDASNTAVIDVNSGSPTVTLSGSLSATSLITTTGTTCTITGTGTLGTLTYLGLSPTTTWTGTGALTFGTATVITNGTVISAPIITGSPATLTLGSAFATSNNFTFNYGTINLNDYNLTCDKFTWGTSQSTYTITSGNGQFYITGSNTTIHVTNFNIGYATKVFTTPPIFNCTYSGSTGTRTFDYTYGQDGSSGSGIVLNVTAGTDTFKTITAYRLFDLNYTGFSGTVDLNGSTYMSRDLTLSNTATYTNGTLFKDYTGTITGNGTVNGPKLSISHSLGTTTLNDDLNVQGLTMNNGVLNLNNKNLTTGYLYHYPSTGSTDYIAYGNGQVNINGSNSIVFYTTTISGYKYTGTPNINFIYSGSTGTRTITTTSSSNLYSFNVTSGSDIVDWGANANDVNFTGFSGTLNTRAHNILGNVNFSSTMTTGSSANAMSFTSTSGTKTITSNNVTLNFPVTFNGIGGTWQFQDAFKQNYADFTLTNGTVKFKDGTTNIIGLFKTSGTNKKYLSSTVPGSITTLSHPFRQGNASYLDFRDTVVVGQINAYLANNNTNSGNNSGWDYGNDFFNMF